MVEEGWGRKGEESEGVNRWGGWEREGGKLWGRWVDVGFGGDGIWGG